MKPRLFASVVVCFACVAFARVSSGDSGPAGIVSELQGSANIRELRKPQRALQVYDWITDGASIAADRGSRVVIVLASGVRFALKEGPRVDRRWQPAGFQECGGPGEFPSITSSRADRLPSRAADIGSDSRSRPFFLESVSSGAHHACGQHHTPIRRARRNIEVPRHHPRSERCIGAAK